MSADLPITGCAVEGFRLIARRPLPFLTWSLLFGLAIAALVAGVLWWLPRVVPLTGEQIDPSQVGGLLLGFGAVYLVFLLVLLLLSAMLVAAICRAVLRPDDAGAGYLRLGAQELRMILLYLLVFAISLGAYLGAAVFVGGTLALPLGGVLKGVLIAAEVVVLVIGIVYVGLRWSLAAPLLVDQGRIDLGRSWSLTRGKFWPLLGMALLALLLSLAFSIVLQIVVQPLGLALLPTDAVTGPSAATDPAAPFRAMQAMVTQNLGWIAVLCLFASLVTTAQMVIQYAPFAAAYRALAPRDEAAAFGDPPAPSSVHA